MRQYISPLEDASLSSQAVEETRGYLDLADQLSQDGKLSNDDKRRLKSFQNHEPARHILRQLEEQCMALRDELTEYDSYSQQAYCDAMQSIDAKSTPEYHQRVHDDPELSNIAHSAFRNSLFSHQHTIELMRVLGIRIEQPG